MEDYSNMKGFYPNYDTFEVGGHKFTLKDCKEVFGHDDSFSYVGKLYIDDEQVCTLYNDGWGGETNVTQIINQPLLDKAICDIQGQPIPTYPWDNDTIFSEFTLTKVQEIADILAPICAQVSSKLKKHNKKNIIIGINFFTIRTLRVNLKSVTRTNKSILKRCNDMCEDLIKEGFYILNAPQMYIKKI